MKKIIIGILLLFVVTAGIFIWNRPADPNQSIDDRIIEAITKEFPTFSSDDGPVIEIDSVSRHDNNWHIATIKSSRSGDESGFVKVILADTNTELKVIAGPDTYFTEAELLKRNIPDSVILELRRS